ncbi:MAG: hypothetical protein WCD89_04050 [Anaerocolumna sp.]
MAEVGGGIASGLEKGGFILDDLALEQLIQINAHLTNIEYIGIVILVAIGLCFGGICLSVFSRYIKG